MNVSEPVTGEASEESAVPEEDASPRSLAAKVGLKCIWIYQRYVSPLTPPSCRYHPTCSHYAYQAIERFGFWRGGWLGLCRVCRCHPFNRGGYDPVPEAADNKAADDNANATA